MKLCLHISRALFALLAGSFLLGNAPASADDYPSKTINLIVAFPAGGRTDLIARIVAQNLQEVLKKAVVIVNKPGASSVLGSNEVAAANPDGYTLGFFSTSVITAQYTVPTPLSLSSFEVVAIVNADPAAIAVNESAPWKTLREFVAYAKTVPGKLRAATIPGASAQIFEAGFARTAGLQFIDVPFKGDADGAIALAGGHIDVHFAAPIAYKALAESHKIRVLGVAADARSALYRDIPTFKENGVDLTIGSFHGVFVPKGTPAAVSEKLATALQTVVSSEAFKQRMTDVGAGIVFSRGSEAQQFVAQQDSIYRSIIDDLGLRVPKANE